MQRGKNHGNTMSSSMKFEKIKELINQQILETNLKIRLSQITLKGQEYNKEHYRYKNVQYQR